MKIERCQGVYEPEDDSYLLMEIEEVRGKIIEIGCGTGIVGLSYAEAGANVTLVDTSEKAVKCASRNATINRISANVVRTDMFGGIKGKFDYCLFNPPYLPSEPPDDPSWTGGDKGRRNHDRISAEFQEFFEMCFLYRVLIISNNEANV
ncbi:MAG: methyltransferase [Candidatus Thermoplasmatota archaeon]|nr:methyltransferase [Candidatus Thermoplasmatota archaeon]